MKYLFLRTLKYLGKQTGLKELINLAILRTMLVQFYGILVVSIQSYFYLEHVGTLWQLRACSLTISC